MLPCTTRSIGSGECRHPRGALVYIFVLVSVAFQLFVVAFSVIPLEKEIKQDTSRLVHEQCRAIFSCPTG